MVKWHEDFMFHILSNVPEEYDDILYGLGFCLKSSDSDVLSIEVIHEKLNNRYEKNKEKEDEKLKEKVLAAYGKQCKGYWSRCWAYGL